MRVWCDAVDVAATGKIAGTYNSLGSITIKKGAKFILGIIALCTNSTPTSGETGTPVLQVDSADLGISLQRFVLSGGITDGIGTNDKEAPAVAEFIPFKYDGGKSIENASITLSLSATVTNTGGWDVAIGIVFSDTEPDNEFWLSLLSGSCSRATGGAIATMLAGISAATATAFTTGISMTSASKELVGLCAYVQPNAPTAGEAVAGVAEFQASQIPDFSPQKWPFIVGWGASLGTPVGTQANVNLRNGVYWPTRFPLPQVSFTMAVSMWLATAVTNAADGIAGARWR